MLSPLLSDDPPDLVRRAKIGDHFHYWRGLSGRRYLFTKVGQADIADFRSVVALIAEPAANGRLVATAVVLLDGDGRAASGEGSWPRPLPQGSFLLIHFLARSETERRAVAADLSGEPFRLAA